MESVALKAVNLVKRSDDSHFSDPESVAAPKVTRAPKSRPAKRPRTLVDKPKPQRDDSDDECSIVTPPSWVTTRQGQKSVSSNIIDSAGTQRLSEHTSTTIGPSTAGTSTIFEDRPHADGMARQHSSEGSTNSPQGSEPRQWGLTCSPDDLKIALFSKVNTFQVHETVVVTRTGGGFCYARVLERVVENLQGVSGRTQWLRVGLKSTDKDTATTQLFKKTMPAVLIGKLYDVPQTEDISQRRVATIGDLLDFIVDETGGSACTATLMRQARALIMQQVQFLSEQQVQFLSEQHDKNNLPPLPLLEAPTDENLTQALGDYCKAQVTLALSLARRLNN